MKFSNDMGDLLPDPTMKWTREKIWKIKTIPRVTPLENVPGLTRLEKSIGFRSGYKDVLSLLLQRSLRQQIVTGSSLPSVDDVYLRR